MESPTSSLIKVVAYMLKRIELSTIRLSPKVFRILRWTQDHFYHAWSFTFRSVFCHGWGCETFAGSSHSIFYCHRIIRCPQIIHGAWPAFIKPYPWLPFSTPMQQTHWTCMQIPATIQRIISPKPMLIPPSINPFNFSTKNQQKWWKRTQFIYSPLLLYLHPFLHFLGVIPFSPSTQIRNHHSCVEITWLLPFENT